MTSEALKTFDHSIQDALELLGHFDALNSNPPPPEIEVFKRAGIVMALAALETYFEDRLIEAADAITRSEKPRSHLSDFFRDSLESDLKFFHTPSTDRVRPIFSKYLGLDITQGWSWNNCDSPTARIELNKLAKLRGEIAHRSVRPISGEPQTSKHIVKREDLRKYIHFVQQIALTTDLYIDKEL
tara:strand:- start:346 stop:900 length:555 start_codon:yes stop_codon:yes gene_type:complete